MSIFDRLLKKAYGDAEGPLGYPMHSEAAKELEQTIAGLDTDCKSYIEENGTDGIVRLKVVPTTFELLEGERADVSLINTDSIDRDKEIVMPSGGDWKSFTKSGGPVTFAHKYGELPVGRAAWVKRVKEPVDGWLAKTIYKAKPEGWDGDWFPDAVFSFVQEGMRGKSVGFIPTKGHRPNEVDLKADARMAEVGWIIDKWVGLEYAVTPIQSNPDAVTIQVSKMRQKGIVVPDIILDEMGLAIPLGIDFKIVDPKQEDTPKPDDVEGTEEPKEEPKAEPKAVPKKSVIITVNGKPIGKDRKMALKPQEVETLDTKSTKEADKPEEVLTQSEMVAEMTKRMRVATAPKGSLSPARVTKRIIDRMCGRV